VIEKARSVRARTIPLAIPISSWDARPRTLAEYEALLSRSGLPVGLRPAAKRAYATQRVALFVEDRSLFATRANVMSRQWAVSQFSTALDVARLDARATTARYLAGRLNIAEYRLAMLNELQEAYREAALALGGPNWQFRPALATQARQLLDEQARFLDNMIAEIASGQQRRDGTLLRRSMMYGHAAWGGLNELNRTMAASEGNRFEENVLSDADHCGGCVEETAKGRVPIGTLVPVGQRDCLANCKCLLLFS
jgi:hypothetical protein